MKLVGGFQTMNANAAVFPLMSGMRDALIVKQVKLMAIPAVSASGSDHKQHIHI